MMVTFKDLDVRELDQGDGDFVEVALVEATSEEGTNVFVQIRRMWTGDDGVRRMSKGKNIALPVDSDVLDFVASSLTAIEA